MSCIVLTNKFARETLSVALRPKAALVLGATFALAADILAVRSFPNLVRPILQDLHAQSRETV